MSPAAYYAQNRSIVQELPLALFSPYADASDHPANPLYAGVYTAAAVDDQLYLGFSASVPTHDNWGAFFAKTDGRTLAFIARLDEQDFNRMKATGDQIVIPGYDPTFADKWDAGNLYLYDTASDVLQKLRYQSEDWRFIGSTATNADGIYQFSDLRFSSYLLRFIPPEGYQFTQSQVRPRTVALDRQQDSNASSIGQDVTCTSNYYAPIFATAILTSDTTIDAGLVRRSAEQSAPAALPPIATAQPDEGIDDSGPMQLGDLVWEDLNGNGLQDAGEPGIADVQVELYTRDPYFPCVVHASGVWGDAESNRLVYNGGLFGDTNITWLSEDFGASWEIMSLDTEHYWAHDLTYHNGFYYKIHRTHHYNFNTFEGQITLLISEDLREWTEVALPQAEAQPVMVNNREELVTPLVMSETNAFVTFQDQLVILHPSGNQLYAFSEGATYELLTVVGADLGDILPAFREPDFPSFFSNAQTGATNRYQTLANADDELLYAISSDNILVATRDLRTWHQIVDFNTVSTAPLITLAYWEARGQVVAITAGEAGRIYTIDHEAAKTQIP